MPRGASGAAAPLSLDCGGGTVSFYDRQRQQWSTLRLQAATGVAERGSGRRAAAVPWPVADQAGRGGTLLLELSGRVGAAG